MVLSGLTPSVNRLYPSTWPINAERTKIIDAFFMVMCRICVRELMMTEVQRVAILDKSWGGGDGSDGS